MCLLKAPSFPGKYWGAKSVVFLSPLWLCYLLLYVLHYQSFFCYQRVLVDSPPSQFNSWTVAFVLPHPIFFPLNSDQQAVKPFSIASSGISIVALWLSRTFFSRPIWRGAVLFLAGLPRISICNQPHLIVSLKTEVCILCSLFLSDLTSPNLPTKFSPYFSIVNWTGFLGTEAFSFPDFSLFPTSPVPFKYLFSPLLLLTSPTTLCPSPE